MTAKYHENGTGGNDDQYTGNGKIWEIAQRYNKQSRELNGVNTLTVRRKSTDYYPVPLS